MCGLIKVGDVDPRGWGLFKEPLILTTDVESKKDNNGFAFYNTNNREIQLFHAV